MDKKIIAIYGGSFNPPLNSHFSLAQEILNEVPNVERVIFVPVGVKYEKRGLLENEHRYNMLNIVCQDNPDFEVSKIELNTKEQLNTYETMRILQKQYSNYELCFVIGTDNLKELETWGMIDDLLSNFRQIVVERDDDDMDEIIKKSPFLRNYKNQFIKVPHVLKNYMSSTYVRNKLKYGKSVKYLMPEAVLAYINRNNLYKGDK